MPNPLLSTGDEGKNQDGHAMVGAKDDALSFTCSHQTFATRDEMKSNIKNRICIENLYHSFRIAGTYDGMRRQQVVHLICAIAWFGSAISMNLLRHLVEVEDAAGMYWMAEIQVAIDMKILVPGAIGCLLTNIVYGAFTNWGFFRHRWLTVKWVFTLFVILFGTFYMAPLVKENVLIGKAIHKIGYKVKGANSLTNNQ